VWASLKGSLCIRRQADERALMADGIRLGGAPVSAQQWAELIDGWFPQLAYPAARSATWPLN
jgi:hypothetical protein